MKIILTLSLLLFLYSCNDGSNLGGDYYYLPIYEAEDIGYPYGTIVYKSKEKNHFDEVLIYSDIEKINYNNQFVIVLQKPNKELMLKRIKDDLNNGNRQFDIKDSIPRIEKKYRKLFLNGKNYYIINKQNNKFFGPLNQKEFNNLKLHYDIKLDFN
ncbi:hypothetical protein [Chryseobacterium sp.]|uniref:hypothetical protein n=1 Tax=Chryseobacterium sp. TaxID=1871047 RepID=UPI000ED112BC|nr:hypothetical protein [Chryseobacterium sp.]HCA08440.1 hypothetical protein [Chryseobacterium sp.]